MVTPPDDRGSPDSSASEKSVEAENTDADQVHEAQLDATEIQIPEVETPETETPVDNIVPAPTLEATNNLGRGHIEKTQPVILKDYLLYNTITGHNTHHTSLQPVSEPLTNVPVNSLYSLSDSICDEQFYSGHRAYMAAITNAKEPKHFK